MENKDHREQLHVNDEINFYDLIKMLWDKKILLITSVIIFGILSVIIALSLPDKYTSDIYLSPSDQVNQTSSLLRRYGGLASMAGINIPDGESSKTDLAIELINSRKFVSDFIEKRDILVPLMAAKDWDPSLNKIVYDKKTYDEESKKWVRKVQYPFQPKPSFQEAYEYWHKEIFSLSQDKDLGFIKLKITHYSPFLAKDWATWIVEDLNDFIRDQDIREATKSLEYLNNELEKVSYDELNTFIYGLIEENVKILSIANTKNEYVFKIIDPAVVMEEKSAPSRALICIIITLLGGLITCLYIIFTSNRGYKLNN